jgi:hypothetical protein
MDDKKHWWIFIDIDEEYFKVGKITSFIGDNFVVVRLQKDDLPDRSELFSLENLANGNTLLFETEEEFNTWFNWLQSPSENNKPKIVRLNPKDIH